MSEWGDLIPTRVRKTRIPELGCATVTIDEPAFEGRRPVASTSPVAMLTRNEFADQLGETVNVVEGLEKTGALQPANPHVRPATYTRADIALAQVLLCARDLGLSGATLARIGNACRQRLRALPPNWNGMVVLGDGFVEMHPVDLFPAWVASYGAHFPAAIIIPVAIPAGGH